MYKNILVINLAFIGDIVLAVPAVRALYETFPDARITMLTVPLTESIARMNPYLDDVLIYDKKGRDKGILGMLRMARRLRERRFDLAVCMNFAPRGAAVAWLARIPSRFGYDAQHGGFFLTKTAPADRSQPKHEVQNQLDFLRTFGITTCDTSLALHIPAQIEHSFREKSKPLGLADRGCLVLCPCGRVRRRSLGAETTAALIHDFSKTEGARPVYLIGSAQDRSFLMQIAQQAALDEHHVLAGTFSLPEIAVLLRDADVLVSVDTGPAHIAQAVHCPVVEIFSTGDPRIWGPRGAHDVVLVEPRDPATGALPATECIESIAEERILTAVQDILRKTAHEKKR